MAIPTKKNEGSPVYLVSCVSQKRDTPAPAGDLYISDWFQKARAYVGVQGGEWYILSALHGVLHPNKVIGPYNHTLASMSAAERKAWGLLVAAQLDSVISRDRPVVFLAGRLYRAPLVSWAGERASVPMEGLGIGQQKAWLARQTQIVSGELDTLREPQGQGSLRAWG